MSSTTATVVQYPEWQAIANTVIAACLVIFLMVVITVAFLKRRNIPISQAIEVDSREPHSITITFIPAQVMTKDTASTSNPADDTTNPSNPTNPTTNNDQMTTTTNVSILDQPQSAPIA